MMEFARSRTEALRPPAKARMLAFRRRPDPAARRIVALVAAARGVSEAQLLQKGRGPAEVALARQLAMYLMHVSLQRLYRDVGAFFDRDRTTVSHACALIEELRDDGPFDEEVARLEAVLEAELPEVRDAKAC